MLSSLPDDDYYVIIRYTSGASDASLTLVMSHDNVYSRARGVVTSDYSGKMVYYGPVRKNGSAFSSRQGEAVEPAFSLPGPLKNKPPRSDADQNGAVIVYRYAA